MDNKYLAHKIKDRLNDAGYNLLPETWRLIKEVIEAEQQGLSAANVSYTENGGSDSKEWLVAKLELANDRYMFNEKFILELNTCFWKRLFVKHYTKKHLREILSRFSV